MLFTTQAMVFEVQSSEVFELVQQSNIDVEDTPAL